MTRFGRLFSSIMSFVNVAKYHRLINQENRDIFAFFEKQLVAYAEPLQSSVLEDRKRERIIMAPSFHYL